MTTAYIIHNSEGVPVRRVLDTWKEDNSLMASISTCDINWSEDESSSEQELLPIYSEKAERQHHLFTRLELSKQYGHRFEIYWPLSTIFS